MKKVALFCISALLLGGVAFADTLSVPNDGTCAMGGTNFGLEVVHDNSSIAFVEDTTPDGESVYRMEFLFSVNSANFNGTNVRQTIFTLLGFVPRPGQFACSPVNTFHDAVRVFYYQVFGGAVGHLTAFIQGDGCGDQGLGSLIRISTADTDADGQVKGCFEWQQGSGTNGSEAKLAVVDDPDSCAGATYQTRLFTANDVRIERIRMGTPQTNNFGAGETADFCFDEFASFRTLSPP